MTEFSIPLIVSLYMKVQVSGQFLMCRPISELFSEIFEVVLFKFGTAFPPSDLPLHIEKLHMGIKQKYVLIM